MNRTLILLGVSLGVLLIGGCGKGGQAVPVTVGSPHIRIRDVVVGGSASA